ncbi:hypothetical protein JOD63_000662 [Microbacterium terrae]|uniref:Helicase XPB/Ssl2 N-terminal domain-containing protein n=1 Tax=Microbacterium terrae TaxID=69369 RepID=A0A0M2H6S3_9MICO|nr:helicase-associated domain-containing protein [Microbacterium terrae]KJL42043.1 hypothetical protein RS81_01199 [Microbacterium terrae]MBP1076694.1 hypothetical protein [Microbacterium terrae]GLJ97522.1 hypothetical protein GCM10017594_07190 [Microbacterium terrae]
MVSDERALATWLAARDDVSLASVLAARGIPASTGWQDFFDAAEALLDPASIDRALLRLPRRALAALTHAPSAAALEQLAFLTAAGKPYAAVIAQVDALRAEHPSAFEPDPHDAPRTTDDRETAAAAERAFTTAGALADVLLAASHAPLGRTGVGPVSAVDRKRLIESRAVETADELEDLLVAATATGLMRAGEREWTITAAGERWLELSTTARWEAVATGIATLLPRTGDGSAAPPAAWAGAYPLDAEWPAQAARLERMSRAWGLLDPSGAEPAWAASLRAGGPVDGSPLAAHLPAEIDRVYLQADLSAISPGPLLPALEMRLRRIAARESRAQASSYRFTSESVTAALTEGETAASMVEFLGALSLTGIPQPLKYLIESTASRHGLVRVSTAATGRTLVESPDAALLDAIAVDQALRSLGLIAEDGALHTRVAREAVYWSLADARYPVVAVDDTGAPESLHRRPSAGSAAPPAPADAYAPLIQRLRGGHDASGDEGWLERELDQAVRARAAILVVVRMPDGAERAFTLEAAGLGGGRLRGRDRAADIERTLPVSSIVSVRPA